MGTPDFAQQVLTQLCESDHQVVAVVTGRDKPSGRGRRMLPTACRIEAERRGLRFLTPKSLKDSRLRQELSDLEPDIFVVCAFRILPPELYNLPRFGSINIHTSLLPKYRGAAPINWAIINGETETGLTSFFLRETVDSGNIILQEPIRIEEDDTYDSLAERMASKAGPFLLQTLSLVESGDFHPEEQDSAEATRAPKIGPFDAMIDFGFPARNVRNFVRGMATKPGAYTYYRGKKLKIYACAEKTSPEGRETRPGTIIGTKKGLIVQCDNSAIEILRLVPDGKKEMDGVSFVNGFRVQVGELLGEKIQGAEVKK